jgi:hypothetical protein
MYGREEDGPMLDKEDFARVTNQEFDVDVGDATVTMTLIAMEPFKTPGHAPREAFSLIFKSANPVVLPQRTYQMRNKGLAGAQKVGVFIVPIGRDLEGVKYQAIFN